MHKLTASQQRFVDEYLVDLNATQAAIRAGYSQKTARSQGQRMLTNVDIQAGIQSAMALRSLATQINANQVLQELALLAFSDITTYIKMRGNTLTLKEFNSLPPGAGRVIKKIKQKPVDLVLDEKFGMQEPEIRTEFQIEIELWDKPKSIDMLCKHLGMYLPPDKQPRPDAEGDNTSDPLIEALGSTAATDWAYHEPYDPANITDDGTDAEEEE